MAGDQSEMRITPKMWEWLELHGATDFELTAFNYLEPAAQAMAAILIGDGVPVGEALDRIAERQRKLGR